MKVIALSEGFFDGSRVRAGQVFEVPQGTKGTWFTPTAPDEAKPSSKPAAAGKPNSKPAANGPAAGTDDLV